MELKEVVQEKYGEAALRVRLRAEARAVEPRQRSKTAAIRLRPTFTTPRKPAPCRKMRCWLRWAAATPRRWRNSRPVKPFSIWDRAAVSMSCCRRGALALTG